MRIFFYLLILSIFCSCAGTKTGPDYVFPSKKSKVKYLQSYENSLALWDLAYEEVDVPTSFGSAHVIISGPKNGDPLVLLHGTDASSTMWFPNVKAFAQTHRVYAIDYPLEAGKSVANTHKMSNKQVSKFYKEVFDHFKMKNISVAGVSRGGWVATYIAMQPENNITKLVLLSPARTFSGVKSMGKVASALRLKHFPSRRNSDRFFANFSHNPEGIDAIFQTQLYYAYKYAKSKPRVMKMYRFKKKQLEKLNMPVLVLVGDHDIVNDETMFDKIHDVLPNATTLVVEDAGHFLSIDQRNVVNKIVTDFINKKPIEQLSLPDPAPVTIN
ncbi:MAG: alpha/beta hydrolase [Flavobacterium sp.]|nr:alpha/beta hydrolase [Flavobacterium sp.]